MGNTMTTQRNPENTRLKKGALYHHFSGKQALGYAVLEELIQKHITELWIDPLKNFSNPLEGVHTLLNNWGQVFL